MIDKNELIEIKDKRFLNYLRRLIGNRIDSFSVQKEDGIHLMIESLNDYSIKTNSEGKCNNCSAFKYRQDIPFWLGSHRANKAMVISQDAGKGREDGSVNCVFSLQVAAKDLEEYKAMHRTHSHYLDLFTTMFGADFLQSTYFTDIVKCAYSTDPLISLNSCTCRNDILGEIITISPDIIVLIGSPAKDSFKQIAQANGHTLEEVYSDSAPYNKRASLKFIEYLFDNHLPVFSIPHFAGDLHIGGDFKYGVKEFEQKVCKYINSKLNL